MRHFTAIFALCFLIGVVRLTLIPFNPMKSFLYSLVKRKFLGNSQRFLEQCKGSGWRRGKWCIEVILFWNWGEWFQWFPAENWNWWQYYFKNKLFLYWSTTNPRFDCSDEFRWSRQTSSISSWEHRFGWGYHCIFHERIRTSIWWRRVWSHRFWMY